jgi:hypothetical protein
MQSLPRREGNACTSPLLAKEGNACTPPLLTKEGPGEVLPDGYVAVILKESPKHRREIRRCQHALKI